MESDADLIVRLRAGDERAFVSVVERYQDQMLKLAGSFVPSRAIAEEVVQDTWLALLRGLDGFEGRSSLKTWLFQILVNRARTTGLREHRSLPVALVGLEPAVDPARFNAAGGWADPPAHWLEDRADLRLVERIRDWIDMLPPRQRDVVLLRDVEGLSSDEVSSVLGISDANLRVLLHRGRSRLRQLIENELKEGR
jgi:RNA polymerase sigma-70 factor (ECF subfamily)